MHKSIYLAVASGFMMSSFLLCDDPVKKINLTGQAQAEISSEQMFRLTSELAAYQNIMKAAKEAQETAAYKKSLKQFKASFNNLFQTYANELAYKLNADEKAILNDIFADVKDMANLIKVEGPRITCSSIDQETREQLAAELNDKLVDRYQQLVCKVSPFSLVAQEQTVQPADFDKNLDEFLSEVLSFMNLFTDAMKKSK